jgi:hypothetical protein
LDLGKQALAERGAQDQVVGGADQTARDRDQPPPQSGDHGLAAAHAVPGQDALACGDGGELVQPGGRVRPSSAPRGTAAPARRSAPYLPV